MGCWWWWFDVLVVWIFQHKRKSMGCWWWWVDMLVLWLTKAYIWVEVRMRIASRATYGFIASPLKHFVLLWAHSITRRWMTPKSHIMPHRQRSPVLNMFCKCPWLLKVSWFHSKAIRVRVNVNFETSTLHDPPPPKKYLRNQVDQVGGWVGWVILCSLSFYCSR